MAAHSYYFILNDDSHAPLSQRVARIESIAAEWGLECHREDHGTLVTLQIETDDKLAAFKFIMCVEPATYESHAGT
jgi:hypothetical protein